MMAAMIIVLLPGTYVRFDSVRTGETLLEAHGIDHFAAFVVRNRHISSAKRLAARLALPLDAMCFIR